MVVEHLLGYVNTRQVQRFLIFHSAFWRCWLDDLTYKNCSRNAKYSVYRDIQPSVEEK